MSTSSIHLTPATVDSSFARESRFDMACKAVRACRAKWLADYFKAHNPTGKPLSEFTGDELAAIWTAATRDAPVDDDDHGPVAAFDAQTAAANRGADSQMADLLVPSIMKDTRRVLPAG